MTSEISLNPKKLKDTAEGLNIIKALNYELDRVKKEKAELFNENSKLKMKLNAYNFERSQAIAWADRFKRQFGR